MQICRCPDGSHGLLCVTRVARGLLLGLLCGLALGLWVYSSPSAPVQYEAPCVLAPPAPGDRNFPAQDDTGAEVLISHALAPYTLVTLPADCDVRGNCAYAVYTPQSACTTYVGVIRGAALKALPTQHRGLFDLEVTEEGFCPSTIPSTRESRLQFDGVAYREVAARVCIDANYPREESHYLCSEWGAPTDNADALCAPPE